MTGCDGDVAAILHSALEAVDPERLILRRLAPTEDGLSVDGRSLAAMPPGGRLVVVGAGKAAAGLARGLAQVIAKSRCGRVDGLLSVPTGCGEGMVRVGDGSLEVRATRPAAVNLPTPAAVEATAAMRSLLAGLGPADVAVGLVTGGGSACLVAPRPGLPLDEKIAVTGFLSRAGADIRELNVVRQAASDVKGGGLARACRAGRLVVLVLSDIVGDPLDLIASGPCLPVPPRAAEALAILERYGAIAAGVGPTLARLLERDRSDALASAPPVSPADAWTNAHGCRVEHVLLGSNTTAVEAAAARARMLGYDVVAREADADGVESADAVGRRLAREGRALMAAAVRDGRPRAVVEGGEAVVRVPADHGRGGRNQQTVVAALAAMRRAGDAWPAGLVVTSIGSDGEDGPTTAAGGCVDAQVAARALGLDVDRALARCDAHPLLDAIGGLVVTGPTGTNVADLRVVLARPGRSGSPSC